ncbi:hypothetical protein KSS87_013197 [Heliosperma pusillum]|nr:hypothetical protein KSS87_013197 [Heliosperma pusillum]
MGLSSYEEHRQKRVDENKKRLEELNLVHLSQSLKNLSPKPSPMKKSASAKSRTVEKQIVAVRRSARVASNPAPPPVYVEVGVSGLSLPRKNYGIGRGAVWNGKIATHEERANTIEKAEQLVLKLEQDGFLAVVRPILPSHVSNGFWLSLPSYFCKPNLPSTESSLTLEDENGKEFPVVYLPGKCGLSGGWRGFAIYKELSDGDALVFQLTGPSVFKVHIIRVNNQEIDEDQ